MALLVGAAALACAREPDPPPAGTLAPAEALCFRLVQEARHQAEPVRRFFVDAEGADPPAALLQRLRAGGLDAHPASAWPHEGARDWNGDLRLSVGPFQEQAPGRWSAAGAFHAGPLQAVGYQAVLRWNGRSYSVESLEVAWTS